MSLKTDRLLKEDRAQEAFDLLEAGLGTFSTLSEYNRIVAMIALGLDEAAHARCWHVAPFLFVRPVARSLILAQLFLFLLNHEMAWFDALLDYAMPCTDPTLGAVVLARMDELPASPRKVRLITLLT